MTPEFSAHVNPVLHTVLNLVSRIKNGEPVELRRERDQILVELRDLQRHASRGPEALRQEYELARKALVYFTDEMLTSVDQNWKVMALDWELYNSQDWAWKFYVEGESQARHSTGNVIELWYLALVLGFKGDIVDGFRRLNRQDFPPIHATDEEARQMWAQELERLIPQRQEFRDLPSPALAGDVRPLGGMSFLLLMLQVAGCLLLMLALLAIYKTFR